MPRYKEILFECDSESKEKFRGANQHSWTIACTSCAFSVYDKTYELEKRHKIQMNRYILRLELRLKRKRIRQCATSNHWKKQLLECSKKQNQLMNDFLHRLHQENFHTVTSDEMLYRINKSNFREKTKKKMRRLAKTMDVCESLTAPQKKMRIKNKEFVVLLTEPLLAEAGSGSVFRTCIHSRLSRE